MHAYIVKANFAKLLLRNDFKMGGNMANVIIVIIIQVYTATG